MTTNNGSRLTTFFTERPLSLAESMIRNSPMDNRRKFRVIIRAADDAGRNITVLDDNLTVLAIAAFRRSKPRSSMLTSISPVSWTVVVAADDIAVRTIPFVAPTQKTIKKGA